MGAYDCDCINNLEYDRRERKAQLSKKDTTKDITSDLISRQQAINAAKDWYEGLICGSVNGLIKRLNALPSAQPEPQWIPVSERLPEESGWHICTCHDGVSERVTFLKWQKRLKQWEKIGTRSYWRVIAWMPLPEPYKGGQNG